MKKCATSPADSLPDVLINKDTGIVVYFDMFCSYFFIVELVVRWSCYRVKFQAREGGVSRAVFFVRVARWVLVSHACCPVGVTSR